MYLCCVSTYWIMSCVVKLDGYSTDCEWCVVEVPLFDGVACWVCTDKSREGEGDPWMDDGINIHGGVGARDHDGHHHLIDRISNMTYYSHVSLLGHDLWIQVG